MALSYTPSHTNFIVEFQSGNFASFLKSHRSFWEGDTLAVLNNLTRSSKAYSTVQYGKGPQDNVELNSDFLYGKFRRASIAISLISIQVNHSCEPNIAFDLSSSDPAEWHVRALKNIDAGSPLTFFYPSTEWEMDQAFECQCGTTSCLGRIQGAKFLTSDGVDRTWVSPWIVELMCERDGTGRTL
ncbi:hypothetical protein C8R44DRAFT_901969 [Mycena epipterygia]|nr:hypothetical protein C8R44DRAFT_901969 [Mycena epipterygia]